MNLYRLTYLLASSLLFPQLASAKSSDNDNIQAIELYAQCGRTLFEQADVLETPAYKTADPATKQDLLEAHFHSKKRWCAAQSVTVPALTILATAAIAKRNSNAISQKAKAYQSIFSGLSFLSITLFRPSIDWLCQQIAEVFSVAKFAFSYVPGAGYIMNTNPTSIDELEVKYIRNKLSFPEELQTLIEKKLLEVRTVNGDPFAKYRSHGGPNVDPKEFIETALDLPKSVKPIQFNAESITKALIGYPSSVQAALKDFYLHHIEQQNAQRVSKNSIFLRGVPGVGKTRAAGKMAEALNVPFEVISLADATANDIVGCKLCKRPNPGLLAQTLAKAGKKDPETKNMILLIDEADRAIERSPSIKELLLTLLEPETLSYYNPYYESDIDISHVGIILAGNYGIEDEALSNRLEIVEFAGFSPEYKKDIALNEILPAILEEYNRSDAKLPYNEPISDEDRANLERMIEADDDKGFRSIKKKLKKFVLSKVRCKYMGECEPYPQVATKGWF